MSRPAHGASADAYVNLRLSVQFHRGRGRGEDCVHYRLMAKPPGEAWTELSTVALGRERVTELQWPPSRDDALAIMNEVLLGLRWE